MKSRTDCALTISSGETQGEVVSWRREDLRFLRSVLDISLSGRIPSQMMRIFWITAWSD